MGQFNLGQFLILVGAMILNIFLVWFGFKLLFTNDALTAGELFLLGCASTLAGVFALSSQIPKRETWTISLILIGVYYFARADGIIKGAWLARILGIASLAAAAIITYIALPHDKRS